jgi:hypothetical protein
MVRQGITNVIEAALEMVPVGVDLLEVPVDGGHFRCGRHQSGRDGDVCGADGEVVGRDQDDRLGLLPFDPRTWMRAHCSGNAKGDGVGER